MGAGKKYDQGKPRMELLPAVALEEIAKVLTFGAGKYDPWNWAKGIAWSRLLGAALRHLFAFLRGEDKDPESGLSHLAHAGCCILFLLHHEKYQQDLDDRYRDETILETEEQWRTLYEFTYTDKQGLFPQEILRLCEEVAEAEFALQGWKDYEVSIDQIEPVKLTDSVPYTFAFRYHIKVEGTYAHEDIADN